METRSARPLARNKGLVIEELGDELLVYDLDVKHAHCLTPLAARVWQVCDGKADSQAIAGQLGLEVTEVNHALDELSRCDLLQTSKPRKGGLSRRDFGLRVTKVAAAGAALPVILSIAAPAVAATESEEIFCIAITPNGGTNNCNICNQQTGANTLCCCCHAPEGDALGNHITNGLKSCAADAAQCCCQRDDHDWGPAHHCTEPDGSNQLCASFVEAGGCSAP